MKNKNPQITLIIPAYNEAQNLILFYEETQEILQDMDAWIWDFIFIDDGSTDATWQVINGISSSDPRVKGVQLSRNFGKEMALTAGVLECAKFSDAVIFMDADLQHDEKIIPLLFESIKRDKFEVSIGSRDTEGGSYGDLSTKRKITSFIGR